MAFFSSSVENVRLWFDPRKMFSVYDKHEDKHLGTGVR